MPRIVGVKFTQNGKVYSFDAGVAEINAGDGVIVETAKGVEYGIAAGVPYDSDEVPSKPLKPILRKATDRDKQTVEKHIQQKPEALKACDERILKHKLDMKLVDVEYAFDNSKIIFYFTADSRVDFRELVKDLAAHFHMRIELRQIGIRDECKMLGGIAPCGRACCCSNHLKDFVHANVKMAKNQGLSLNPTKISGLCGRLMCCLQYENAHYVETGKKMPKLGSDVTTPEGSGTVASNNMLKETVKVKLPNKDGFDYKDFKLADIKTTVTVADEIDSDNSPDTDIISD